MNQYREGKVKSTPTRGVKQYLKPNAYNQSELDWSSIWMSLEAMKKIAFLMIVLFNATIVSADEFVFGLGYDDVFDQTDTQSGAFVFEYHANPFYEGSTSAYSFGGAAQVDGDGDVFVGLGVTANWSIGDGPWFVEGSFMPGYYDQGSDGTPLEGNVQFRTLLGLGYSFGGQRSISLSIDHKSNANLEDENPGSETLTLRYTLGF